MILAGTLEPQGRCRITDVMRKPKHTAQIENIYFLSRIGSTLRWATQDIAREDLPADIKRLLGRLDRLEARAEAKNDDTDGNPAA
jgi:hypothetical protein